MVRHLGKLGFPLVYNRNEDFYAAVRDGRVPDHDVLASPFLFPFPCSLVPCAAPLLANPAFSVS